MSKASGARTASKAGRARSGADGSKSKLRTEVRSKLPSDWREQLRSETTAETNKRITEFVRVATENVPEHMLDSKVPITLTITARLSLALDALSKVTGRKKSEIVRSAISDLLNQYT